MKNKLLIVFILLSIEISAQVEGNPYHFAH